MRSTARSRTSATPTAIAARRRGRRRSAPSASGPSTRARSRSRTTSSRRPSTRSRSRGGCAMPTGRQSRPARGRRVRAASWSTRRRCASSRRSSSARGSPAAPRGGGSAMQERWNHFIDGHAVPPKSARYLDDHNPATGEKIAEVARGDAADVAAAVAAARAAFAGWRDRRPIERGRILLDVARKIREKSRELAALERLETGKPPVQVPFEIEVAAQYFELYGGLVNAIHGETIDLGPGYHSYTRREPFGVVGVILPWNAPLNQAGRAVAPALSAGNTVVAKPSEFTSASLLELARLAVEECGLPPGVLNVVTGTGAEAGAALVAHRDVRKVAFTGSVRAGREVGKIAAERIIPLTLELGGKSPNIVFADADLKQAVPGSIRAFVLNAGQVCLAGTRILVERPIHDTFVQAMVQALKSVPVGGDDKAMIGPMTTQAQYDKVKRY